MMLEALLNRCHARARTEQNRTLTKYLCLSCMNKTLRKATRGPE
jgi:hypothetical protein